MLFRWGQGGKCQRQRQEDHPPVMVFSQSEATGIMNNSSKRTISKIAMTAAAIIIEPVPPKKSPAKIPAKRRNRNNAGISGSRQPR